MGLIGLVVKILGVLILAVVAIGAFLWFTDYEAEATITDKGRDAEGDYIVLRPKIYPRDVTHHIDAEAAQFVCEGYQVGYRLQTKHTTVRDAEGRVVYDSENGLTDLFSPIRCSGLGLPA
jgi:hypothetical protein